MVLIVNEIVFSLTQITGNEAKPEHSLHCRLRIDSGIIITH